MDPLQYRRDGSGIYLASRCKMAQQLWSPASQKVSIGGEPLVSLRTMQGTDDILAAAADLEVALLCLMKTQLSKVAADFPSKRCLPRGDADDLFAVFLLAPHSLLPLLDSHRLRWRRRPANSIEQSSYIRHRPKQLHRLIRKWQKTLPFIEATGTFIFRIHDHRERRNLATGRPVECIAQEKPPVTFSLVTPIHCEPSQKRRRDQRISWQIPHRLRRQLGELHRRRGERVVARDRPIRQDQDERRGHVLPCVLSCLCPKISVEGSTPLSNSDRLWLEVSGSTRSFS